MDADALGGRLFSLWERGHADGACRAVPHLARALVYLRRTGLPGYSAMDHARLLHQEKAPLQRSAAAKAFQTAFHAGATVRMLGETSPGVVIYMTVGWDSGELYPAVWYVVAAPALLVCRGHGADEIEGH